MNMMNALLVAGLCALPASASAAEKGAAAVKNELPREAARRMNRGHAAFKAAKTPQELLAAAKEFELASEAAPKWPDPVFNRAQALEKAGDPAGARKAYERYLELAPEAADAAAVQKKIDELEFLAEKQQQEKEVVELGGNWNEPGGREREVKLSGNNLTLRELDPSEGWTVKMTAVVSGRSFEGNWNSGVGTTSLHRVEGRISDDNRRISWRMRLDKFPSDLMPIYDPDGDGWSSESAWERQP